MTGLIHWSERAGPAALQQLNAGQAVELVLIALARYRDASPVRDRPPAPGDDDFSIDLFSAVRNWGAVAQRRFRGKRNGAERRMSAVHGGSPPWPNDALRVNAVGGFAHGRDRRGDAFGQRGERVAGLAARQRATQVCNVSR